MNKEELLFLHLNCYDIKKYNYFFPKEITQKGIQDKIGCSPGLLSTELKKNIEKGYIFCIKAKIEDQKRNKNAYFLTSSGKKIALEIKRNHLRKKNK